MYLVELINGDKKMTIHDSEVSTRKIKGQINIQINSIDSFTFTINKKNHGYDSIVPFKTSVYVMDMNHRKYVFKGRVLKSTEKMDTSGMLTKEIVCESELGFLNDSTQTYGEYHNISVKSFLEMIINRHNEMVDASKHFKIGEVTVEDSNDSLYRYVGYDGTLDTIKAKLIEKLGGEIQIRYDEKGDRYIDYLKEIGIKSTVEIRVSRNLKSVTEEKDPLNLITRLVPLGAKIKNEDNKDTEQRIDITSVNHGIEYIDDVGLIEEFGIISKSKEFDDINTPSILLSTANKYMQETNRMKRKFNISALDLSAIKLDVNGFEVGNYYHVLNPIMHLDEDLRVIAKTIDINVPQLSSLTIGDKFDDFNYLFVSQIQKVTQDVKQKVSNDVYNGFVKKVVQELSSTALTTTISEGLQSNDSIKTSKFSMDIDGLKIYNSKGELTIFQDAQTGDLKIKGDMIAGNIDIESDASIGNILRLGNMEDADIPKFILFNGVEFGTGSEYHGNFIGYTRRRLDMHGEEEINIGTLAYGGAMITLRGSDVDIYATGSIRTNKQIIVDPKHWM